jgi:hypothetical protein
VEEEKTTHEKIEKKKKKNSSHHDVAEPDVSLMMIISFPPLLCGVEAWLKLLLQMFQHVQIHLHIKRKADATNAIDATRAQPRKDAVVSRT